VLFVTRPWAARVWFCRWRLVSHASLFRLDFLPSALALD